MLAIVAIGAVSAADDLDALSVDDAADEQIVEAVDDVNELAVDDASDEEIVEASADDVEIVEAAQNEEVLGDWRKEDFNFVVKEEVSVKDPNAVVLSWNWPADFTSPTGFTIKAVGSSTYVQKYKFSKAKDDVTLGELGIDKTGDYTILVTFGDDGFTYSFKVKVTENGPSSSSSGTQTQTQQGTQTKSAAKKESLTFKKVAVKKSAKKLTLKATVKINGKAKKGLKVKFKFNKKNYTAKTNAKGVATLIIKKSVLKKLKVGKKVTYRAAYDKVYTSYTVKVKK